MIRVLHMLGSLNFGGSQTMLLNIYRSMDREQVQFDIIIDHKDDLLLAPEFEKLGSRIFVLPAFTGSNIREVRSAWSLFFKEHSEYKILHSHVRSYASIYLPIAKRNGLKTIIHSHNTSNGTGMKSAVKKIMQFPLRYQADYLMACSREAGKWLFGTKACEKTNYIFLPNAIDIERFRFAEAVRVAYRKELGVEDKLVLGHVGRFHEAKNHMFLLDIFANLCVQRSDAVLLLVGDGELREKILLKIHDLKLDGRVILTGNRNDVPQLMQAMDVFVFPSLWEGLPVAVVEAQAAGLPCFISDNISNDVAISSLVKQLPSDDLSLWVNAILEKEIKREEVLESIKAAGFDIKNSAKMLEKFYFKLGGYA